MKFRGPKAPIDILYGPVFGGWVTPRSAVEDEWRQRMSTPRWVFSDIGITLTVAIAINLLSAEMKRTAEMMVAGYRCQFATSRRYGDGTVAITWWE